MLSSCRTSVYNFPIRLSPRFAIRLLSLIFLFLLWFISPGVLRADSLEDGVRLLARRVGVVMHGATVEIREENRSSLQESHVAELGRAFRDELSRQNVKTSQQGGTVKILLTFSENASGYLGVVRLQHGTDSQDFIQVLGKAADDGVLQQSAGLTLRRELLLTSEQPILDAMFPPGDANKLVVLGTLTLTNYDRDGGLWKENSEIKLPRSVPVGRDLRGRLSLGLDELSVAFPNETCTLSTHDGQCHPNRGQVNLSDMSDEALKEANIEPGVEAIKFQSGSQATVMVAGKDGRLRLYHRDFEPFLTVADFGGQLSYLQSDCGVGQQILVTGRSDQTSTDFLQAMELREEKLVAVTQPVPFSGPILALRPATRSAGIQPTSGIAIVHNLPSGNYEVYRLTISCGN